LLTEIIAEIFFPRLTCDEDVEIEVTATSCTGDTTGGELANMPCRFNRPPVAVRPTSEVVGAALPRMALRICEAVAVGNADA